MRCEEIMKTEVECAGPKESVENAARKMRDQGIGFLPVCEADMAVQGTLTDRDIAIRLVAEGKSADAEVEEIMTREVVACRPDDDIRVAEDLLRKHKKSRIMCTDESGRLVGVISLSDIAQHDEEGFVGRTLREVTGREAVEAQPE